MIPKIIHYCWFGNQDYPENVKKYIDSWKKYLPEYKFMLWNEKNFDYKKTVFTKQAYENKKYAFVSDYVRLYALKNYGGIYLDTDVELISNLDDILNDDLVLGYEEEDSGVASCFIGSKKNHIFINKLMDYYEKKSFLNSDGSYDMRPNTLIIEENLKSNYNIVLDGKETLLEDNIHIYTYDYFHPMSLISGKMRTTSNTKAIHWHTLSWVSWKTKIIKFIRINIFIPIFGVNSYKYLERFRKR